MTLRIGNATALLIGLVALSWMAPDFSQGQPSAAASADSTLQPGVDRGEADPDVPKRRLVKWNEYDGPITSVRVGVGFLYEVAAYAQDGESKQQFALEADDMVRDFRVLVSGRLKTKRPVTWKAGLMYDGVTDEWLVRETGMIIAVPELWGHFFVGRTKEGFSLNKVMNGYHGWTMERQMALDVIPILGDGVRWMGYLPGPGILWNIGGFTDWLSEDEGFSTFEWQVATRVAWLPIFSEANGKLLHLGLSGRYGQVDGGTLRVRSRPEANPAPYFIDTDKMAADHSRHFGYEAYYRAGPWLFGSEYYMHSVSSPQTGNPVFHGGDVVAVWNITGETRGYNTVGGVLKTVSPTRTVFEGGPGAWEAVLRLSFLDLNGGTVQGGEFWRITPMVSWYLSDNVRLEFCYGYGTLDRFDLIGGTQFFQSRFQFSL